MNTSMRKLMERIDALSLRERGMLVLTLLVVMIMLWHSFLMEPLEEKLAALRSDMQALDARIKVVDADTRKIVRAVQHDPNDALRKRIRRLEKESALLDSEIQKYSEKLVSPDRMAVLLEKVVTRRNRLNLESLANLAAEPLVDTGDAPATNTSDTLIYKHGMRIEVTGAYHDLLEFLGTLESMGWGIYWDRLSISSEQYPRNRAIIQLHTVSVDSAWIGV